MKQQFAAILLLAGIVSACDDEVLPEKVPLEVRQTLLNTFPQATYIEWEKSGKDYEADFDVRTTEHSALFRHTGNLVQYKRALPASELPEAITNAIAQNYSGYKISEAEVLVRDTITSYQLVLKKQSKEVELVFAADGQQLRQPFWD